MRMLLKVNIPVDAGNDAAADGSIATTITKILQEQKPEAAYFTTSDGERTALIIVNIDNAAQLPALAEPWFLAFNANVDIKPVMNHQDLTAAGPAIQQAVQNYGDYEPAQQQPPQQ